MHFRLPLWSAFFVFIAFGLLRAQTAPPSTPATAATSGADAMREGQIVAKKVTGTVSVRLNGTTTELHENDRVSQASTIITASDSSVILVFSNGATTQLGSDTALVIEEFMQDPFQQDVAVGALTHEPTRSRTKLNLTKGELLGKVAKLKHDEGSYFRVETPVGAAGIRGTTFRIVFRPTGTGQAFAVFSLSTLEGNVNFQQPGAGGAPGQPAPGQPTPGQPEPSQPGAGGGVPVVTGQEVVVTVNVDINPQTGVAVVTAPPVVTSTNPISIETQATLTAQAQVVATTAAQTTFTPTPPTPPATSGTPTTDEKKSDEKKPDEKKSDGNTGTTSGADSAPPSGTSTTSTTVVDSNPTPTVGNQNTTSVTVAPPSPPPASNLPILTPGAGKAGN